MVLVLTITFASWLAVVVGVLVLCRGAHQLDEEIERDVTEPEFASLNLPFAS